MKFNTKNSLLLSCVVFILILLGRPSASIAQNIITKVPDFNGDGKADLLWRNQTTRESTAWLMDGITRLSSASLLRDPAWRIASTADFNGDNISDLLLTNANNGQMLLWLMNGTTIAGSSFVLTDPSLKFIEAADLNGDGKTDLLLYRASTGETIASLMNGTSVTSSSTLITDSNWSVATTADFNGDRSADILWYNATTGQTMIWLMNGTTQLLGATLNGGAGWRVVASADFNGDGKADLVGYNAATGQTDIWLMNGITTTARVTLTTTSVWTVIASGDFNGDGKSDLLWSNSLTGDKAVWLMSGTNPLSRVMLPSDLNWKITAIGDLDKDGKSDILWYNNATGQTAVWLMDGTTPVNGANLMTDPAWRLECIKSSSVTSVLGCDNVLAYASVGNLAMPTNQAPVLNAGQDQTISQQTVANLHGTATDDGLPIHLLTSSWSRVSGPGSVVFSNPSALISTAQFSAGGTYTLRLTASDSSLSSYDDVVITVNAANQAPTVNAGPDQTITLPAGTTLAGSATDDGLPTGSTLTRTWSKVGGPGTVTFGNVSSLNSTVTFSVAGTYTLRLTASDSLLSSSDDIVITVNAANQAPTVNAGPDQTITLLPTGATLAGAATDDGLPTGSTLQRTWSKVSGPGTVTFGNVSSLSSTVTFSVAGTYTLRLTASDSLLSSYDDVVFVVNGPLINLPPIVNAGPDQTITLPSGATLAGAATDDGLPFGTLTRTWSMVSGPGTVTFGNGSSLNSSATFSAAGTYVLQLSASDGAFLVGDTMTIIVNPAQPGSNAEFYVDPTFTGPTSNGTPAAPWKMLDWTSINAQLATRNVVIYFSARQAGSDTAEVYGSPSEIDLNRRVASTFVLTLDGHSKFNINDTNPSWQSYVGTSRAVVRDFYAQNPSHSKRSNITIDGFEVRMTVGGKAIDICGDNWVVRNSDIYHTSAANDGPLVLIVPTSDSPHEGSAEWCAPSTNIIIESNTIHDSYGELVYVGGGGCSQNDPTGETYCMGFQSHTNVTIRNNKIYNGGVFGGQGDGIDVKGGITNLLISGNEIYKTGVTTRAIVMQGMNSSGPDQNVVIENNYIHDNPTLEDAAIAFSNSWGTPRGVEVRNNVIVNNAKMGIKAYGGSKMNIYNNTVYGSSSEAIYFPLTAAAVINNLLVNNNGGGSPVALNAASTMQNNAYSGTWPGSCTGCISGILQTEFVDAANLNFHLATTARSRGTGIVLTSFSNDKDGILRSIPWDLGAY